MLYHVLSLYGDVILSNQIIVNELGLNLTSVDEENLARFIALSTESFLLEDIGKLNSTYMFSLVYEIDFQFTSFVLYMPNLKLISSFTLNKIEKDNISEQIMRLHNIQISHVLNNLYRGQLGEISEILDNLSNIRMSNYNPSSLTDEIDGPNDLRGKYEPIFKNFLDILINNLDISCDVNPLAFCVNIMKSRLIYILHNIYTLRKLK